MRNLDENLLFFTLILASVFSDYVAFYGDSFLRQQRHLASANISWYSTGHGDVEQTAVSDRNTDKNWELHPYDSKLSI